jgi:protein-disulfide isomerase
VFYIPPVTQDVNTDLAAARLETVQAVHYNLRVSNVRFSGHFVLALLCAPLLMGGACEKKTKSSDTGAVAALDNAHAGSSAVAATAEGPADTTPLAGIDLGKLDGDKTKLFYKLVGSLKSPCGKAHSLRTSFTSDTSCKRAPFAVRYVLSMIEDEGREQFVRDEYSKKYEKTAAPVKFDTSKAPHAGAEDARIKIVEFFDYECPHCQAFKSEMEGLLSERGSQISVYFMMFPLESVHPQSRNAAQAAVAANALGKFAEMHDKLFAPRAAHGREDVIGYAKAIGLDPARFEKAFEEASAQVTGDLKQGENAGVDSTPTIFFNDRKYEGPPYAKYLAMWIDEELAVNR